ncbi:hypothetical protein QBC35DRAFT_525158 [Podospora australis]|uniref:Nephrocystin 3-like N-terminal domain-containing protein n=1 Tax=Podospora australis TaxID=1536484 RepID=A0AAN6WN62_9PEZI|nr:hypothetical protein QBC35DRAFT_525158 [Podospora australis]
MSGLEPLAVLALAGNVLQLIGAAHKTIEIVKQVYQTGEVNPALTDHAVRLEALSKRIQTVTATVATTTTTVATTVPTATQDTQVLGLAQKCLNAAEELRKEVNSLKLKGSNTKPSLWKKLKITSKTLLRQRTLDKFGKEMLDAEHLLQTGLLTKIFESAGGGLEKLDADLRSFLKEYRETHLKATELICAEADKTRKNVTTQIEGGTRAVQTHMTQETGRAESSLKNHITLSMVDTERSLSDRISAAARTADEREKEAEAEVARGKLLCSLKFDRMNERRNMVVESHPETYDWVLSEPQNASEAGVHLPWDSFPGWLQSTEPAYWISGKLGSGKTTLVKFLLEHSQTRTFLDLWNPDAVLVSHFFWRPGTQMQQSIKGFFCSLLYQLLENDKGSLNRILSNSSDASKKDSDADWSPKELQSTLLDVMAHYPRSIVLFLDGLDEVLQADGTLALLNVIDSLKCSRGLQGKVKLCLGARREPLIEERLGDWPQLRLEDLNYADLRRYAKDKVIIPHRYYICMSPVLKLYGYNANGDYATFSLENPPTPHELRDWVVTELVRKAEGVFLWLCLTAKMVMEALERGETVADLQQQVNSLPSDLSKWRNSKLYAEMWARENSDSERSQHQERACLYFYLAINDIPVDFMSLMIATNDGMVNRIRYCDPYQPGFVKSLVGLCKARIRDVEIRGAGLLQIYPIRKDLRYLDLQPWYGKDYHELMPYAEEYNGGSHRPFGFIHRTARDFLTDTAQGLHILRKYRISEWHLCQRLAAARLACCRLFKALPTITELLGVLPEENKEKAICECDELLQFCEQLFKSGQLFENPRLLHKEADYRQEGREKVESCNHSRYEVRVKREHEFLFEAASFGRDIWHWIYSKLPSMELDKQTLSELLLHLCNFTPNHRYSASQLSRLLERGPCPSRKGPRPVGISGPLYQESDVVHAFETPLKALISSVWELGGDECMNDSNLARKVIELLQLLMSNGADPEGEEFRVTFAVFNGMLFEMPLRFNLYAKATPGDGLTGMQFIRTYPLSMILGRILQSWKDRFPELDTCYENRGIIQDGAMVLVGRSILMLHSAATPARMCIVGAEEELEDELFWVAREADGLLHTQDRNSYRIAVPPAIKQGLSRALERKDPEGVDESQKLRRLFELFQRVGITSVYCGDWEEGCYLDDWTEFGH